MSEIGKGYKVVSSDSVIHSSGTPIAVYGLNLVSGAGGGSKVILRNGTTSAGTAVITYTGVTSEGKSDFFGGVGVVFPSGCFVDTDANIESCTIVYEVI